MRRGMAGGRNLGGAALVTAMLLLGGTASAAGGAEDDLGRVLREFDAAQRGTGTMVAGTHLLVLTPRRKRLRERLVEMRLWIDRESALPRRIGYLDAEGDSTLITLHDPRVNVAIDADRFRLALPPDVIVSNRFNGFALGGGGL